MDASVPLPPVQVNNSGGAGGGGAANGQMVAQQSPPAGGQPPPKQPSYTIPGIVHHLQAEWQRFEQQRQLWDVERAELQARIALLQGERKGQENLKNDLVRRIKMLEYCLRQVRVAPDISYVHICSFLISFVACRFVSRVDSEASDSRLKLEIEIERLELNLKFCYLNLRRRLSIGNPLSTRFY